MSDNRVHVGIEPDVNGDSIVFMEFEHGAGSCRHYLRAQSAADLAGALLEAAIEVDPPDKSLFEPLPPPTGPPTT